MKIYGFSDFTQAINQQDMVVSFFGYADVDQEWCSPDCSAAFTRIYMILEGEAFIFCKGECIQMRPGNIYVIPAGLTFSYRCDNRMQKLFFHINMTAQNNHDWFNYIDACIVIKDMEWMIREVSAIVTQNTIINTLLLKKYLYEIVYDCFLKHREKILGVSFTCSELVLRVVDYIESNLTAGLQIQKVAEDCNVSVANIKKRFKAEMQVSIGKYIDDRIMSVAERRLRMEQISVGELSDSLGFCDQSYFSEKFKKKFGVPPTKYRKLL